jgi:hypothetical protein
MDRSRPQAYKRTMDNPTARVRVSSEGVVSVEVDISPNPDRDVLVPLTPSDQVRDEDDVRRISGSRLPRWIELSGGG